MEIDLFGIKSIITLGGANASAAQDVGDMYVSQSMKDQGVFKAYIPKFMYKPPFGYPRTDNVPLQRQLSKNAYVHSIHKTIYEEVAFADWDIRFKKDSKKKDDPKLEEIRQQIKKHFSNPNKNKESWSQLRMAATIDMLEVDSGVWVKVFNRAGEYSQLFARDGGSFLKNFDIYGYLGAKDEYIDPMEYSWFQQTWGREASSYETVKQYDVSFAQRAAYFQYGTAVSASIPVPFGKREIVYMQQHFRSDDPYGRSPIQMLSDIITTLVYGSNYNLDFYMNGNMPEGMVQILGAQPDDIKNFRKRIEKEFRVKDPNTGFTRKIGYRFPITGFESKFVPFQLDPKTMQILEQQSWFYKLALACYGVPIDEMGFTEDSNTSTGANQHRIYLRKAAKPIMINMKYRIDMEIISEWGQEAFENLEYHWIDYDLDEEVKKFNLYKQQVDLGVMSPKMIAEEEGIDFSKVEAYKKEQQEEAMAQAKELAANNPVDEEKTAGAGGAVKPSEAKDDTKRALQGVKALGKPESDLEEEMRMQIKDKGKDILSALDNLTKNNQLAKI